MKPSKKTKQILDTLAQLKNLMDYYTNGDENISSKFAELEVFIKSLSTRKKIADIKIAQSVKKKLADKEDK